MAIEKLVEQWSERELIVNALHQLRQSSAAQTGLVHVLRQQLEQSGLHTFDDTLALLEQACDSTAEVAQWLQTWAQAQKQ